ncbi:uncharacterized protein PAC_02445 [Phialocephala subalpina]|uniref:2EXR domain-containing protein n=1 Tax=Phialocephala subalpina TaxID=576137 RepID=A0A1L7WIK1_9HELO|nr:uncharacterized protein PAC_02445 [Phialocephala subalpina]
MEVQIKVSVADDAFLQTLNPNTTKAGGIQFSSSTGTTTTLSNTPDVSRNKDLLGKEIYTAAITNTLEDSSIAQSVAFHQRHDFPRFQELAGEIQNQIFGYLMPGPRTVAITTNVGRDQTTGIFRTVMRIQFGVHPIATALLHVSHRSRALALEKYSLCFEGYGGSPVYFSLANDTLYFAERDGMLPFSGAKWLFNTHWPEDYWRIPRPAMLEFITNWQQQIQHVAIDGTVGHVIAECSEHLAKMPNLKTITITIDLWVYRRYVRRRGLARLPRSIAEIEDFILEEWREKRVTALKDGASKAVKCSREGEESTLSSFVSLVSRWSPFSGPGKEFGKSQGAKNIVKEQVLAEAIRNIQPPKVFFEVKGYCGT